jgi:hypothetical protein
MTFMEMITEAYQNQVIEDEKAQIEAQIKDETTIIESLAGLGVLGGFKVTNHKILFEDGIELEAIWEYGHLEFRLYDKCPQCDALCYNQASTLAGIGEMVNNFQPYFLHTCKSNSIPEDYAGKLIEALQDYIISIGEES